MAGIGTQARLRSALRRISPDGRAVLVIVGAVLLANLLSLLGVFDANPLGPRSGLIAAVTPGPLPGQPTIDPNVGFISQAVGHRAVIDLLHGQLPWWDPFEGTGAPLAGGLQAAAFFPLTLLTWFSNGLIWEHVLLECLSGVATYLLLRRLVVGRIAATAAGVAFALNGTFSWFAHATVNPIAFLPLLVLGVELALGAANQRRPGGWWLIALAGALSFYAGFPEVAYINALLVAGWLIWRAASIDRARLRPFLGKVAAGGVSGLLLCVPLLIATVDYFNHGDLWLHAGGHFSHVYLPTRTLPQQLMPYVFGPILAFTDARFTVFAAWLNVGGYLGAALLVLGLIGLLSPGRRGLRIVLGLWIVLMLARMYHAPAFLGDVVNLLPGMSNTAVFRYASSSVEFAAVILAAFGIDALTTAEHRRRVTVISLAAVVVIAVGGLVAHSLTRQLGPVYGRHPYLAVSVAGALAVVGLVAVAACVRRPGWRAGLAAAALAGEAVVLFVVPQFSAPRSVAVDTAPVAFLRTHLGLQRYFTLGPLAPNYGAYYGLASLNAVDVPVPTAFQRYVNRRLDPFVDPTAFVGTGAGGRPAAAPPPAVELLHNLRGYREAGVAYVLTPAGQPLPTDASSMLTLVDRTPSTWIYRVSQASAYMTTTTPGCSVLAASRTSARTNCPQATVVVRRETDMPGWTATVDGRGTAIRCLDGTFQAVRVPPGSHRLSFAYSPPGVGWGGLALLVGLAALIVPPVLRRRGRRLAPTSAGVTGAGP